MEQKQAVECKDGALLIIAGAGTGKTTVSVNLASYLAEEDKVVLTDLDVEEPNSKLFLETELFYKEWF